MHSAVADAPVTDAPVEPSATVASAAVGGPGRTRWAPVVALGMAMLVVTSEMTISAVTLPGVAADLGVSPAATAWVLLGYMLPMAALAIPGGRWADRAEPRAVFLLSMLATGLTSVLGATAPEFWVLLVARLLQGLAGGLVVVVYMPIITTVVREAQRGQAIGYIITIMTVGGMAGVPLGGLVAGALSWREVFLMKLPLLILVVWLALRTVPGRGWRLPLPDRALVSEAGLVGGAVTALLLAFDQLTARPLLAGALAVGSVGLAVSWARQPSSGALLSLVRRWDFAATVIALMAISLTGGLTTFLLPYLVAEVLGGGPRMTGVALLFFVGAIAPVSALAGLLTDRYGTRITALAGAVVSAVALVVMLTVTPDAGLPDLAWRLALLGLGAGLFNAPINTAILVAAPAGMSGTAGGVGMTARTVAMTLGSSVAALCWTVTDGGLDGFRAGVGLLAAAAVVGVVVLALPRRRA